MAETLVLSTTRISTHRGRQLLTGASGFFFERGDALFLVTSRHVLHDPATGHFPDRVEIELHLDPRNLTQTAPVALPLYADARALWRQGSDSAGDVDIAALRIDRAALPAGAVFSAFGPGHLLDRLEDVQIGAQLLVVGFPLSFFDTVHRLPVARHAIVASAFGVRFQGQGYFVTDARLHRGASGAPVVMRDDSLGAIPWRLLGVHAARLDMENRDTLQDDTLGLNCAWYADILLTLTGDNVPPSTAEMGPRHLRR
jgi:S1-C subfamily serine protease